MHSMVQRQSQISLVTTLLSRTGATGGLRDALGASHYADIIVDVHQTSHDRR